MLVALANLALSSALAPPARIDLQEDLRRLSESTSICRYLVAPFQWDAVSAVDEPRIPAATIAFSRAAFRRNLREQPPEAIWRGYCTRDGLMEVMTVSWSAPIGRCVWADTGQTATIRCELDRPTNLETAEGAADFVEGTVRQLLAAPSFEPAQIRHWLKPVEGNGPFWAGRLLRGVALSEVKRGREKLLRHSGKPEWHQDLTVATDGRTITLRFTLPEPQPGAQGARKPGTYRPFRFRAGSQ